MLVQKCVGFIEGQGKKCPHLQTAIDFYHFLNLLFNIGTKCRTDLGQWLILMFVCRLNKWIGKIISYKLQNLSYPKGQHMNTIGGQVFEFSEFFIQNLHYVQDWPWTMINFDVCLPTQQMNWENHFLQIAKSIIPKGSAYEHHRRPSIWVFWIFHSKFALCAGLTLDND